MFVQSSITSSVSWKQLQCRVEGEFNQKSKISMCTVIFRLLITISHKQVGLPAGTRLCLLCPFHCKLYDNFMDGMLSFKTLLRISSSGWTNRKKTLSVVLRRELLKLSLYSWPTDVSVFAKYSWSLINPRELGTCTQRIFTSDFLIWSNDRAPLWKWKFLTWNKLFLLLNMHIKCDAPWRTRLSHGV